MKKIGCIIILIIGFWTSFLNSKLYDSIFIIINNDVITLNDYRLHYYRIKKEFLKRGLSMPKKPRLMVFNQLVNEKIIKQTAEKKELFVSDTEVDEAINRIKKMNRLSDAGFMQALRQEGKTLKELEEEYRKQILTEKIMSIEVRPRISQPEEEEVRDYYKKNKRKMVDPPKIQVSHILIRDNPNASLKARSKLKDKAKKILQEALKGKNFSSLVRKYSQDEASASIGGNIGYIAKGEWLPEIDKVLFSLKKGQIARQVLTSRWGFHIVKITGKKRKQSLPFDDVRSRIVNFLVNKKMKDEFEEWIKEKKQNSYFEVIFPENEKYIFDYDKWQKKNSKKVLSKKKFERKIESIKL